MSERLNVKNMVGGESKRFSYRFLPSRDITQAQLKFFEEYGKQLEQGAHWVEHCRLVGMAKVLGIDASLSPAKSAIINSYLASDIARSDWISYLGQLAWARLAGVHLDPMVNIQRESAKEGVERVVYKYAFDVQVQKLALARIADIPLVPSTEKLEGLRELTENEWLSPVYLSTLAEARLLGITCDIPDPVWDELEALRLDPASIPKHSLERYFYAAILSADQVIVPEGGGLKLVYGKDDSYKEGASDLPVTRSF